MNEIAKSLRDLADSIEAEGACTAVAIVLGDDEGVTEAMYIGFMEPHDEIVKFMFKKGIEKFDEPKDSLH